MVNSFLKLKMYQTVTITGFSELPRPLASRLSDGCSLEDRKDWSCHRGYSELEGMGTRVWTWTGPLYEARTPSKLSLSSHTGSESAVGDDWGQEGGKVAKPTRSSQWNKTTS